MSVEPIPVSPRPAQAPGDPGVPPVPAEGLRERVLLIAGGPRVTNLLAAELGYDAGFGRGTLPSEVATFIARGMAERVGVL